MGEGKGREGFGVIRYDLRVSPLPAHGGQGFLFLILILVTAHSLFLSQGGETDQKKNKKKK